jgi:hypothetical protein
VASWWGEPGRAGWAPDLWLGAAPPQSLAGLAVGGWTLDEPGRAPVAMPWPGVMVARSPLAWFDSLAVDPARGGWDGYGAGLAGARALSFGGGRRMRGTFTLVSGTPDIDETVLSLDRGDSLSGMGADLQSGQRGGAGALDLMGRHVWDVHGRLTRGRHRFAASFAQRGAASQLRGNEQEAVRGESGLLDYRYRAGADWATVRVLRGHDGHESFGGLLAWSRRDAQQTGADVEAGRDRGAEGVAARFRWRHDKVGRIGDGAFERETAAWWGATSGWIPLAAGRLTAAVGGGHHASIGGFDVAPDVTWEGRIGSLQSRFGAGRTLAPVWSDVAPGVDPFLQSTWSANAAAEWKPPGSLNAGILVLGGRTHDRALVARLPLEEQWLRAGLRADRPWSFTLVQGHAGWSTARYGVGAEGFVLGRTETPLQPDVDPASAARAFAESHFHAFQGDLGVVLRGAVEFIGRRMSETTPSVELPSYASFDATAEFTLADVVIVIQGRHLEDRPRAETWIDSAIGSLARGPGREVRFALTWRLLN